MRKAGRGPLGKVLFKDQDLLVLKLSLSLWFTRWCLWWELGVCSSLSIYILYVCSVARSCPTLLWPPWMVAQQTPLSMGLSWQEYWNRLPFPSPLSLSTCLLFIVYLCAIFIYHLCAWVTVRNASKNDFLRVLNYYF